MHRYLIILLLSLSIGNHIYGFKGTLATLQAYAQKYEEYPPSNNENWIDPRYEEYHRSLQPSSIWGRLAYKLGFGRKAYWDANHFKQILLEVIKEQHLYIRKYLMNPPVDGSIPNKHVARVTCKAPSRFFIWSDLHGAFHSLTRDLTYLKGMNVITEDLKIIDNHTYFIFNGDSINRSAYTLETLEVLIQLIHHNPTNVFYMRGKHETNKYWENFALKRDLQIRAAHISAKRIPLEKEINDFFETLPLALYINTPAEPYEVMRFSHQPRDKIKLNEQEMGTFFETPPKILESSPDTDQTILYDVADKQQVPTYVDVRIMIETEEWLKEHRILDGLALLDQDEGATTWSILSSPIPTHQKYYSFWFDAFAEVNIGKSLRESSIALHNQNLHTKRAFKKVRTLDLILGVDSDSPYFMASKIPSISFGSSISLIRGVPVLGQRIKRGVCTEVNSQNISGGIQGYPLRFFALNDDYNPFLAEKNINFFLDNKISNVIVSPVGSPTLEGYLNKVKDKQIAVLFPITGAKKFRNPELTNIINFRATYSDEVIALIETLVTNYNARKFAFFYQDDAYGLGPLATAHEVLKKYNITTWTDIPYTRSSVEFDTQKEKLLKAQPDAIGFFSSAFSTREFISQVGVEFLTSKTLFGISFLGEPLFRRFLKNQGLNILFGAVVPNPYLSKLPIVEQYRKAMDVLSHPYDVFSLESYITSCILFDNLTKLSPPYTKEQILAQLESLNNYNYLGINLTFKPQTRSLAEYVWIETSNDKEWIRKKIAQ